MSKKTKIVQGGVLVAAVLLLVAAVVVALINGGTNSYSVQLQRGDKYLAQADYDNAVLAYQAAIAAAPQEAAGYIGLATVYINQSKMSLAQNTLRNGLEKTGSARMKLMLETYFGGDAAAQDAQAQQSTTEKTVANPEFDTSLFENLAQSTYDDYRRSGQITTEGMSGDAYEVQVNIADASLEFNTVADTRMIDSNTGKPYSDKRPNSISLENITVLFGGGDIVEYTVLVKANLQGLKIIDDETYGNILTFSHDGCEVKIACDADGTIHKNAWNSLVPGVAEEVQGMIAVSGQVTNATTGNGVADTKMQFRLGSATNGEPAIILMTGADGGYTVNLDPGEYTVEISCQGFKTEYFDFFVTPYHPTQTENFSITPPVEEGQIRVVLEWGSYPSDLDLWLSGAPDGGSSVMVGYRNKLGSSNGSTVAQLDVDDTTGYGPETITLYDVNGDYEISVVDFRATGGLAGSGATVKVYLPGQDSPVVITAGSNLEGSYGWSVCRINHGEVEVINTSRITYSGAPAK